MLFCRIHRRFAAWLAMWVMVFGALAPTVAQAMVAASDKARWVEVCSASGMVWLKTDGAGFADEVAPTQGNNSMGDMGKHCPWCGFHGPAAGLPPAAASFPNPVCAAQPLPERAKVALVCRFQRSAQARAPPHSV